MSDRVAESDDQTNPREHSEEVEDQEAAEAHPRPARGGVDQRRRNREKRGQRDREPAEAFQVSAGALRPLLCVWVAPDQRGRRLRTPQPPRPPEERRNEQKRRRRRGARGG